LISKRAVSSFGFGAGPIGVGGGVTLPTPITVDPTLQLTSAGTVSPIRQKAHVEVISTTQFRLGTSASMSAHFVQEGVEVTDDSPTVSPATIQPQRAQAFAQFSIEAQADWSGISANLTTMLADAKNTLEGVKFLSGAGEASHEPQGPLTGSTWQHRHVQPAQAAGSLRIDDERADLRRERQSAAPPITRRATWRASPRPTSSSCSATCGRGTWWSDRIGLSVEIVPHVFGSTQRPLGIRGLYAYWRTSALVVNPAAVKVIQAHA
jgi:predicted phage gp36 major capsid-like protein